MRRDIFLLCLVNGYIPKKSESQCLALNNTYILAIL